MANLTAQWRNGRLEEEGEKSVRASDVPVFRFPSNQGLVPYFSKKTERRRLTYIRTSQGV